MTSRFLNPVDMDAGANTLRRAALIVQLLLVLVVVSLYQIEGDDFAGLITLAAAGFVVNLLLPLRYRLPFFVLLSFAGLFLVFGAVSGAWLIALGLTLIGMCHLPAPFAVRVAAVLVVGGVFAAARGGAIPSPWAATIWPILGSMFMFRLVLYMHAVRANSVERGPWWTLAYFFMLPNAVFPLFPVVDYNTFRKTYYDRDETAIHEQGLTWIARGLVHLVLYRLVYQRVVIDSVDVATLGDLVQSMLGTFLLYLRVSGQFHLIVGILHLFGFRLPETHHLYYLSHSFTELWRRINIYWKDFMMKVVFYPTYFTVRKSGPTMALVLSTAAVFVTTWLLHSYQWFWLRGGFPLTPQDGLFWGILGVFVVYGALREAAPKTPTRPRAAAWSWRSGAKAAWTFSLLCFLWSLWSTESIGQWLFTLEAATRVDAKGVALLFATITTITILGARNWERAAAPGGTRAFWRQPAVRSFATLIVLVGAGQPVLDGMVSPSMAVNLQAARRLGLNSRDAVLRHRGYYEELDLRGQLNEEVLDATAARSDWQTIASTGLLRTRRDLLQMDLVPSRHVIWNGETFGTNAWGMRDREYSREKPPGTLRIALLGPSFVAGSGVSDQQTFEALVEERLNREFTSEQYTHFEILNFAVSGYTLTQQVALLEDRVFEFSPDIVIVTHYRFGREQTEQYLLDLLWGSVAVPPALEALFERAGLTEVAPEGLPVPFSFARRLLRRIGLETRMPYGESEIRVRSISDDVIAWSFRRFTEVALSHGVVPMVLGLNAVVDDAPPGVPDSDVIRELGLPVFDLVEVFPRDELSAYRVAPWDDHPNAAGHRLIAARLYDQLAARLRDGWRDLDSSVAPHTTMPRGTE
jgi:D-alanyl-lipoteichoic acid acyltransferase DltB (MBOAT superfamily)